jgi:hypothetical protein
LRKTMMKSLSNNDLTVTQPSLDNMTRRQFLALCGISIAAVAVPAFAWPSATIPPAYIDIDAIAPDAVVDTAARALHSATIRVAPSDASAVVRALFPDEVVGLRAGVGEWYQLADGFVRRVAVQPLQRYGTIPQTVLQPARDGVWAWVFAPFAAVRAYAAADAPLVARVGYGAVVRAVDVMDAWVGVTLADDARGWVQAAHITTLETGQPAPQRVMIDTHKHTLFVYDRNNDLLASGPISTRAPLPARRYTLQSSVPSAALEVAGTMYHGVPLAWRFGAYMLTGAYWHHQFGGATAAAGADVSVPVALAHWLNAWVGVGSQIDVVA